MAKCSLFNAFLLDETHRWKIESKNLTKLSRDSRRKSQNYMEKLKAQEDQHKKCTSKDASISWRRRNCKKSYSLEFTLNFSFSSIFMLQSSLSTTPKYSKYSFEIIQIHLVLLIIYFMRFIPSLYLWLIFRLFLSDLEILIELIYFLFLLTNSKWIPLFFH